MIGCVATVIIFCTLILLSADRRASQITTLIETARDQGYAEGFAKGLAQKHLSPWNDNITIHESPAPRAHAPDGL